MSQQGSRQSQVEAALSKVALPSGLRIRPWKETDFPAIQRLSALEGWPTPQERPEESLDSWRQSWPTLVAIEEEFVIGFVRALTDGFITTYIAELLVETNRQRQGIGRALLDVCHYLHPHTRADLLSEESADGFYEAQGFRPFRGFRKSY